MSKPTIAVLAPGAMGSGIGRRLAEHGARVLVPLAGRGEASRARAASAGMADADDAAIARADIILSIIPPADSVAMAERMAATIKRTGTTPLFVDGNAVDVKTMKRIAAIVTGSGARCIDGCIIGPPPKTGDVGPRLYVSGEGLDDIEVLRDLGIDLRLVPGGIGAASALKMSYAGITKGLTALAAAMILAATDAGADDALIGELFESQPDLLARFAKVLPDMYPKAGRWAGEMREVAAFLGPDRRDAAIYEGMAALYERIGVDQAGPKRDVAAMDGFIAKVKARS